MPELRTHHGCHSCERAAGWDIVTQLLNLGDFRPEDPMITMEPLPITRPAPGVGQARVILAWVGLLGAPATWGASPRQPPTFGRDIWPIVAANCLSWHGADQLKGGLDLRSVATMRRGG